MTAVVYGHIRQSSLPYEYEIHLRGFPCQDDCVMTNPGRFYHALNRGNQRQTLFTNCRYVERNPLRANLIERAADWP